MPSYSQFLVQNRILETWKMLEIREGQFSEPKHVSTGELVRYQFVVSLYYFTAFLDPAAKHLSHTLCPSAK